MYKILSIVLKMVLLKIVHNKIVMNYNVKINIYNILIDQCVLIFNIKIKYFIVMLMNFVNLWYKMIFIIKILIILINC